MASTITLVITGAIISLASSVVTSFLSHWLLTQKERRENRRLLLEKLGKKAAKDGALMDSANYAEIVNQVKSVLDDDLLAVWHGALNEWTKEK